MRKAILLLIFWLCLVNPGLAQLDEFTQNTQSKYFNIYSPRKANFPALTRRLHIRSEYLLLESAPPGYGDSQDMLGAIIDALFLEACDILHMYVYNFKGNIKICQNQAELNRAFSELVGQDLRAPSFYVHNTNSIYINIQDIRSEVLAYEIAQAIISHYYAVLPPPGVQEILAKDVQTQIRRLSR